MEENITNDNIKFVITAFIITIISWASLFGVISFYVYDPVTFFEYRKPIAIFGVLMGIIMVRSLFYLQSFSKK